MPAKPETEQAQLAAQFREECLAEGIIKPESEAANDEYLLRCASLVDRDRMAKV
jgi:hypothetical protein